MFGFFKRNREVDSLKEELKDSFNQVKKDFNKVGEWIGHIDQKMTAHEKKIDGFEEKILDIHRELMELKRAVSFFSPSIPKQQIKQPQTEGIKQTMSVDVQTVSQTNVQTANLSNLTLMERGIVWTLMNSELNLSYEDVAALLGKDKSTIRGQINSIRQKIPRLIEETRENNGRKRLHISREMKEELAKTVKVRVESKKNGK